MNEQQAIDQITKETCGACMGSDASEGWRCNICGYRKAIEALEKQIQKKPIDRIRHRGGFEIEHCQNCDSDYEVDRRYIITDQYCSVCGKLLDSGFRSYCSNCGQKIEGSVEE